LFLLLVVLNLLPKERVGHLLWVVGYMLLLVALLVPVVLAGIRPQLLLLHMQALPV
jgi:hypothetical protein